MVQWTSHEYCIHKYKHSRHSYVVIYVNSFESVSNEFLKGHGGIDDSIVLAMLWLTAIVIMHMVINAEKCKCMFIYVNSW